MSNDKMGRRLLSRAEKGRYGGMGSSKSSKVKHIELSKQSNETGLYEQYI
jgi:hypothetical protein